VFYETVITLVMTAMMLDVLVLCLQMMPQTPSPAPVAVAIPPAVAR
jgi:hypothetical protein